jgi:hypothetical protein
MALYDANWEGPKTKLFMVMGSAVASIAHGPQRLPQLILLDDAECRGSEE